ncbi:hypothetical protein [Brucella melitensis]|uniref:hypothetical protein n=1 Tax=Brucella melitensis TaxID=29459 RepID=UPI0002CEB5B5|nr:hypothetical protein [Brucella melitensis]ENS54095.1 hypothetical protein C005_01792 [Brucella melitensis BG2 (S27)]
MRPDRGWSVRGEQLNLHGPLLDARLGSTFVSKKRPTNVASSRSYYGLNDASRLLHGACCPGDTILADIRGITIKVGFKFL